MVAIQTLLSLILLILMICLGVSIFICNAIRETNIKINRVNKQIEAINQAQRIVKPRKRPQVAQSKAKA